MKIAFSTVACPKWDFETIASRAKEYGYDGVELRGFLNESVLTAANPFLTDPKKLRALFEYHGTEIACLASSIAMSGSKRADAKKADEVKTFIDTASALGCPIVKIFDSSVKPGSVMNLSIFSNRSRSTSASALSNWLLPLGDHAAANGVVLVVENALSFRDAKELWLILDRIQHPSVGACWDVFNAALIGEAPAISVPTLNSKIMYTQVKDAKLGPLGASYCNMGEGDVEVRKFLIRLMGIGYDGWVTFEWEKAWLPNIAEPEVALPQALAKLREWTKSNDIAGVESDSEAASASTH